MIAVSLDSKLDSVMFYQVREQSFFHGIQIVLSRVKAEDRLLVYTRSVFLLTE